MIQGDSGTIRIAAIDDHPAILSGVIAGLNSIEGMAVVAISDSVTAFLESDREVDVVLLDLALNDDSDVGANVEALRTLGLPVLLFTQERRPNIVSRAFRAGAAGIVGKHEPLEALADAVTQVAAGQPLLNAEWASIIDGERVLELAPREAEAVRLYAAGLPVKSVARRMGLSQETVKEYLMRVRRKYAAVGRPASTKTALYMRAVEDGYLDPP